MLNGTYLLFNFKNFGLNSVMAIDNWLKKSFVDWFPPFVLTTRCLT